MQCNPPQPLNHMFVAHYVLVCLSVYLAFGKTNISNNHSHILGTPFKYGICIAMEKYFWMTSRLLKCDLEPVTPI